LGCEIEIALVPAAIITEFGMKIAVIKETSPGEQRVALIPDVVSRLVKQGLEIWIEVGAGEKSFWSNEAYTQAGAEIVTDTDRLWSEADVVLKVAPPNPAEASKLRSGATLISCLTPLANEQLMSQLARQGVTSLAMELIPRSTRAQSMDALSSQASIAGYKAVLLAAAALPKYFPMLTTAAGTIAPAKVFVIGAGVAGLQAIATARRLGAIVEAFDIRPAVREEVQSLGAKFVEVPLKEDTVGENGYAKEVSQSAKELTQQTIAQHVRSADVVITTAQVPGKKAPLLVTAEMVSQMRPGSVIVDLAAEQGGNCAYTEAGKSIDRHQVMVIGTINLPASVPVHASQLYAKNISTLLQYLIKDGALNLDFADDIVSSTCVTHEGHICHDRVRTFVESTSQPSVVA
jgi:H+-translocating NAD(P) transhydrogenase subunit alpha